MRFICVLTCFLQSKLEGMFQDMDLARELFNQYKSLEQRVEISDANNGNSSQIECQVSVLNAGYWPTFPTVEMNLPLPLVSIFSVFIFF